MSKTHIVKQGECIASIASSYGFFPDMLWNLPENQSLKALRKDPYVLFPGDKVVIPEKRLDSAGAETDQRHRFRRKGVPESLTLRFEDEAGDPLAEVSYSLEIDGKMMRGTTDTQGAIEQSIPPDAKQATVTFDVEDGEEALVFELTLGGVDPIEEESGYSTRLQNLGYLDADASDQDLRDAILSFQADHGLEPSGVADTETREAIKDAYEGGD